MMTVETCELCSKSKVQFEDQHSGVLTYRISFIPCSKGFVQGSMSQKGLQ